jgi:hypothetical protein
MRPRRWMFCVAVIVAMSAPRAFAHDPGLSTLDVRVGTEDIIAVVSLDPSDVQILTGAGPNDNPSAFFGSWIREAVQVLVDGFALDAVVEAAADKTGAMQVTLRFRRPRGTFISIRSTLADRAGRGHRTLVTINDEQGRRVAERLIDITHPQLDASLEPLPANPSAEGRFGWLSVAGSLTGYDYALLLVSLLMFGRWMFERRFRNGHQLS